VLSRSLAVLVILATLGGFATSASARKTSEVTYDYGQVWATAVRLVRVDYGFNVRDRDEEVGFLLFDYVESGRTHAGSIELVRVGAPAEGRIRIVVQVPSMPSYVEQMLLERLRRKLRDDFGMPIARPAAPAAAAPAEDAEEPAESTAEDGDGER
jgi:hypothetical protein